MARTHYVWDVEFDSYLMETDENHQVKATYTVEPEPFGRVVSQHRDGKTHTYHYDGLGSTVALTDDTGTVTDTFGYDAWGNEIARTGTTETPFRWVGELGYYYDEGLDENYVRARQYRPQIGRWASADPLGLSGGPNAFLYVGNRTVAMRDPSGLHPAGCHKIATLDFLDPQRADAPIELQFDADGRPIAHPPKTLKKVARVSVLVRLRSTKCEDDSVDVYLTMKPSIDKSGVCNPGTHTSAFALLKQQQAGLVLEMVTFPQNTCKLQSFRLLGKGPRQSKPPCHFLQLHWRCGLPCSTGGCCDSGYNLGGTVHWAFKNKGRWYKQDVDMSYIKIAGFIGSRGGKECECRVSGCDFDVKLSQPPGKPVTKPTPWGDVGAEDVTLLS